MTNLRQTFRESPKDFRPVPWWAWSGDMTRDGMDRQMLAMRDQGIYEFFIFAVYGLDTPFNSDEYFEMVKHTLDRCREWGMKAWIYDEYNWPSGICGGEVLRDHPWTRYRMITYHAEELGCGQQSALGVRGEFVRAFFVGRSGRVVPLADVTPGAGDEVGTRCIGWCNTSGEPGRLLAFSITLYDRVLPSACGATWTWNQPGYLDVMDPEAVQVFVDYCYEPYAERFPDYFGKELPGFFTDEPGLYFDRLHGDETLPYTRHLWARFRERWGYALEDRLPELVAEIGDWVATRRDYWQLVTELFAQNCIGQINNWCVDHGLEFTGHFLGEETLRWNVRLSGDIQASARLMTVPGIDLLRDYTSYDVPASVDWYGHDLRVLNTTAKVVSSAADYARARRRMVEAYGVVDHDQSLMRMKRMVDWLAALGLNLINDNTMVYSLKGFRKRRVSGKTFTTPWFPSYGQFSEHVGRVCWMTTVGEAVDDVAVLYPTMTGWTLYGGSLPGSLEERVWTDVERALVETTDALNQIQRGWKFIFDDDMASARVEDGRLVTGGVTFTTVVLPAVVALAKGVYESLRAFAEAGGQVILVGLKPCLTPDHRWDVCAAVESLLENESVVFLEHPDWGRGYQVWLDQRIGKAPFSFAGAGRHQILVAQRRDADHHFAFISNQTAHPAEIAIRSSVEGSWELWDPDSGEQWALEAEGTGGERCWSYVLAPMQSVFVVVSREGGHVEGLGTAWLGAQQVVEEKLLGGTWEFQPLGPNMVRLDPMIRPDPRGVGDSERWHTGQGEWLPTLSGRTELKLDPDEMAYFWVKADINLAHLPADLELVLDSRDYGDAFINGHALSDGRGVTIWDEGNWAYPLSGYVFQGRNVIVLRCRPSKYYADRVAGTVIDPYYIEPIIVQGAFAAFAQADTGHLVVPETGQIRLGAWEEQGYPAFCGTGMYRREVDVPDADGRYWLVLDDVRHVAEVLVNGTSVGVRPWPPHEFEISEYLHPGENDLAIRVTNNLGRIIRHSYTGLIEHPVLSGLVGRVRLVRTR